MGSRITLENVRNSDAFLNDVIGEATTLINSLLWTPIYRQVILPHKGMFSKTGKARMSAPKLENLPLITESFSENVKTAHLQVMIWESSMSPSPHKVDRCLYVWAKYTVTSSLKPIGIPPNVNINVMVNI